MDVAYNQHSERAKRKNRSSTNINHLSLAPLTVKLPINDGDAFPESLVQSHGTYLAGKSAPATPRLLSRGSATPGSRSHRRTPSAPDGGPLLKSRSSVYLNVSGHKARASRSGTSTPRRRDVVGNGSGNGNENGSDWLLRAGALLSSEAREYKGQSWLVSRQSSTSLAGMRDVEEEAFEQELARERQVARSRRGSFHAIADGDATPSGSRINSRFNSRKQSMAESRNRSYAGTPLDRSGPEGDSYFSTSHEADMAGPDFVNLDEKLEELERDTAQDDEAAVRKLVRHGTAGKGSWISNVIGWSLFKVDENEDDEESDNNDEEDGDDDADQGQSARTGRSSSRSSSHRHFEDMLHTPGSRVPPPTSDEGGWKDAAWLLSVASKVMF